MNAKQKPRLAKLFVRIPADLKGRIEESARAHGTSVAKETERLLGEQLAFDIPARNKQIYMDTELKWLRMRESFIANFALDSDVDRARKQLGQLQDFILNSRATRLKVTNESVVTAAAKHGHQEVSEGSSDEKKPSSIDPLLNPGKAAEGDWQLSRKIRRRKILIEELEKRPRGTKKQLAEALGWTLPQISQLLSHPAAAGHRNITDEVASRIEKALELNPGSISQIEQLESSATLYRAGMELEGTGKALPRFDQQKFL